MNKCLVVTGGGDCPGLNAVIRAIVKRASNEGNWEIYGSRDAFNGILKDPIDIVLLTGKKISGIHVRGGTILGTTNKGGPFNFPIEVNPGEWIYADRSDDLLSRLQELEFQTVINIGGDGSQKISQKLFEKGLNIIGVPKTIDNDLKCTDFTFGFQTAVETATDAVDKLVTTAASHHRIMILEVMGRDAGWIALYAAIAGGAEICLIPEIPYNIDKIKKKIDKRIEAGKGFVNIVIAEGAKPLEGKIDFAKDNTESKDQNFKYAGAGFQLKYELEAIGINNEIRMNILGHIQRGGSPNAFDRILATRFGIKAFELVLQKDFGKMVTFRNNDISAVPIKDAIKQTNLVDLNSNIVHSARGLGISFGD